MYVELAYMAAFVFAGTGLYVLVRAVQEPASRKKARAQAVQNKDATCDALFNGRPVVTYTSGDEHLPANLVIEEAGERGYALTARTRRGRFEELAFTRHS